MIVRFLAIIFGIGVGIGCGGSLTLEYYVLVAIGVIVSFVVFRRFEIVVLFFLCACGFFYPRIYDEVRFGGGSFIGESIGEKIEAEMHIVREPDIRLTGQKLTVSVEGRKGYVLLTLPSYPRYEYGQTLSVYGLIEEPFENEDFSYKNYLRPQSVFAMMKNPSVRIVEDAKLSFFGGIFAIKSIVQGTINEYFLEPYASFMSGILIGARKGIPKELMDGFGITGLTHIIAISGYNISLVVIFAFALFGFLPRRPKVIASGVLVVIFTIFVGMSSAVVRAAVMGIISLAAIYLGRLSQVVHVLFLTAVVMVVFNPYILLYDVGFQLSFLATIGVVLFSDVVKQWFEVSWLKFVPEAFGIREGLIMTLSAQLTTLPLILFQFEKISIVSPLANLLVTPFVPLSMVFGGLAVLMSFFHEFLALPFVAVGSFFLRCMIFFTEICAGLPYAQVTVEGKSFELMVALYGLLWYMYFRYRKIHEKGNNSKGSSGVGADVSESKSTSAS